MKTIKIAVIAIMGMGLNAFGQEFMEDVKIKGDTNQMHHSLSFYRNDNAKFMTIGHSKPNDYNSTFDFHHHNGNPFRFLINDKEILKFLSNGNVGIGTANPRSRLDLGTNYSNPSIYPNKITLWSGGENNYFGFGISSGDLDYFSQGNHRFYTGYNGTPGSEKMVIRSNGNVGVGTINPSNLFDVENNKDGDVLIEVTNSNSGTKARSGIKVGRFDGRRTFLLSTSENYNAVASWKNSGVIGTDSGLTGGLVLRTSTGKIRFQSKGVIDKMVLDDHGNLGVGTTNPKSRLDLGTNHSNPSSYPNKITLWSGGENNYFGFGISSGDLDYFSQGNHRFYTGYNGTPGSEKMVIQSNGNVGIGTINPGSWRLAVNGQIRAKEIKVETEWSDFVFYDDYNLPTLNEVENHIKEKGHLKDIPSAKDVEKNGIYLGEMDAKLLQKIEELTLYTIQQQKEIEKLKKQNSEIKELKALVQKLLKNKN